MCVEKTNRLECRATIFLKHHVASRARSGTVVGSNLSGLAPVVVIEKCLIFAIEVAGLECGRRKEVAHAYSLRLSGRGGIMESESNP
jgi:hypothetical protein